MSHESPSLEYVVKAAIVLFLALVLAAMLTGCYSWAVKWENGLIINPTNTVRETQDGVNYLLQGTGAHY